MVQLIFNGMVLPESIKGGYSIRSVPLSVDVEMASGLTVRELRGNVWEISYQFGYFNDEDKNRFIQNCELGKSQPIVCGFLVPESDGGLRSSSFWVMDYKNPTFGWSRQGNPIWADFSVSLREVRPHD